MKTPIQLKGMLLLAALAISAIAAEPAKPADQSFLFIGNSFTFRHELKDVFLTLAKEGNPGVDFSAERVTYGGRDMFRHFELFRSQDLLRLPSLSDEQIRSSIKEMNAMAVTAEEPEFYKEYWRNIDSSDLKPWEDYEANGNDAKPSNPNGPARKPSQWMGDRKTIKTAIENHEAWISTRKNFPPAWSYVVLQSWQDVIANPETGYIKYATKFAEVAKRQTTKVVLYLTAPYSQNKEPVGEPLAQERAFKELHIASDLAKKTGAIVVPVPLAVYRLQKSGAANSPPLQK